MSSEKTLINDLTEGSITSKLIRFALPFMLANILQALYTMVDLTIVGHFVGSTGLSGVSVGSEITIFLTNVGVGFSAGGQILIAQLVGMKDYDSLKRSIGTLLTVLLGASIVLGAVGIIFTGPFLSLMHTPVEAWGQARTYLTICCCGMPFIYIYNAFCALLRGMGDSKRPLLIIAISAGSNIILDLLLVAAFKMEAGGAALATVISQAISAIVITIYLYRHREKFYFDFKLPSFRIDTGKLRLMIKLGLPLVLQFILVSMSMLFITSQVNVYGVVASAVTGAGAKLGTVASVISSAMQTAISTMVGQNVGAEKPERAVRSVWIGWAICIAVWAISAVLCLVCPRQLFSIFNTEPEVLDLAVPYLRVMVVMYLGFALMAPAAGLVLGTGATTYMLVISLMDGVVARIGLSLLFTRVFGMGMEGFWWGNALAGYVMVLGCSVYFFAGRWKKRRIIEKSA